MPAPADTSALQKRRQELLARIAALGDLRPGSLIKNYRRCGRPNCFCTDKQHPGHGPNWLLTRTVKGKTRSQSIPASQVKPTQAQIAECQRLRRLIAELIDVSDDLCRSRLMKGTSAVSKNLCAGVRPGIRSRARPLCSPGAVDGIDLEAFELHVRHQALRLAARAVERRLNADFSDGELRPRACSCGRPARYAGRFPKTFETALGPLTLERAYYHCQRCGKGFCPRDAALGLLGTSLSPAVTRMTGSAAALASFRRASDLLAELGGVTVRAKHVERVAEELGREIAAAESAAVFYCALPSAPTMYLGIDGTGVPMRPKEVAGRAGKQADGSAGTRVGLQFRNSANHHCTAGSCTDPFRAVHASGRPGHGTADSTLADCHPELPPREPFPLRPTPQLHSAAVLDRPSEILGSAAWAVSGHTHPQRARSLVVRTLCAPPGP